MNRSALVAMAFPLAVMGAWLARLDWLERSGTPVQLAVTGFDPRDLLAGHYLTYTVSYGPMNTCPPEDVAGPIETCVCLAENSETRIHEATWAGDCSERPATCGAFIKGTCRYGRFDANIERFYFPEAFQSTLAVVPEKSTITVVLRPTGEGLVTGFAVDGVQLLDYAKAHGQKARGDGH